MPRHFLHLLLSCIILDTCQLPPVFSLTVAVSDDHISFITPSPFLTVIDPIAQVALPPPLVQERNKGVDVGSAGPTPDDGAGCHHRKLLQGKPQNKINPCVRSASKQTHFLFTTYCNWHFNKDFLVAVQVVQHLCRLCPQLTREHKQILSDRFRPEVYLAKSYSEKSDHVSHLHDI